MSRNWLCVIVAAVIMVFSQSAWANSVETLPQGVFALGVRYGYKWASERFGNEFGAETENIADDYNVTIKGEDLSPDLKGETIGRTVVDYEDYGMELSLTTAFGVTDNIALMMIIPFQYYKRTVNVGLADSTVYLVRDGSGNPYLIVPEACTLAWEVCKRGMNMPEDATLSDHPLTGAELQDALTSQADTDLAFGYKPIEDAERWGLGEIITGVRYKFYETPKWRQGLTVFAKWPTGKHDDSDNLIDSNFGDQQIDIGFWYGVDYLPIPELTLNLTFGYTEQLPDIKRKRVPVRSYDDKGYEVGVIPMSPKSETRIVRRDIGGNWDLYWGGSFSFAALTEKLHWLNYSNEFYFFWKYEDNYWGKGSELGVDEEGREVIIVPDYRALEKDTNQAVIEMTNSLGFSTLGWVMNGDFPVPLMLSVGYTVGLAGQNFEKNNTIWVSLDLIGSIYMFDTAEVIQEKDEDELQDFKLPGRSENGEESDSLVADGRKSKEEKKVGKKKTNRVESDYRNSFGKVRKYDW